MLSMYLLLYCRVNGCVGVSNYRYYIQFLCYVSLLGSFTFASSLAAFVEFHGLVRIDHALIEYG